MKLGGAERLYSVNVFPVRTKNCYKEQGAWCPFATCGLRSTAAAGRMRPFLGLSVCAIELLIFGTGII